MFQEGCCGSQLAPATIVPLTSSRPGLFWASKAATKPDLCVSLRSPGSSSPVWSGRPVLQQFEARNKRPAAPAHVWLIFATVLTDTGVPRRSPPSSLGRVRCCRRPSRSPTITERASLRHRRPPASRSPWLRPPSIAETLSPSALATSGPLGHGLAPH